MIRKSFSIDFDITYVRDFDSPRCCDISDTFRFSMTDHRKIYSWNSVLIGHSGQRSLCSFHSDWSIERFRVD